MNSTGANKPSRKTSLRDWDDSKPIEFSPIDVEAEAKAFAGFRKRDLVYTGEMNQKELEEHIFSVGFLAGLAWAKFRDKSSRGITDGGT